jgi:hypothetical protein
VPGDLKAPAYLAALERVGAAAAGHGKAYGLMVPDGTAAAAKRAEGWRFVAIGSDASCSPPPWPPSSAGPDPTRPGPELRALSGGGHPRLSRVRMPTTSSAAGMEGAAPGRCTHSEAAALAN